jgi:hypothetical protein
MKKIHEAENLTTGSQRFGQKQYFIPQNVCFPVPVTRTWWTTQLLLNQEKTEVYFY